MTDIGCEQTVLSKLRTRLLTEQAERLVFEQLLWCSEQQGWLATRSRQRPDSTHVLATIRAVTRLEGAGETLQTALNALAVVTPVWLQAQSQPESGARYSERSQDYHLPISKAGREQQAQLDGADGKQLLDARTAVVQTGYVRFQQLRRCDEFGCSNTMCATRFIGGQSQEFPQPH